MNNKWTIDNITDQSGRIAIVTGANSGIGFAAARVLAEKGAEVIVASRSEEKGQAAVERIKTGKPGVKVKFMRLDLASLKSVKEFADRFRNKYDRLDLLINNAAVMMPPYSKTEDGFELQFGTNHLGHFALTGHLLDLLLKAPGARIVNVSSVAHRWGGINFDDLNWESKYDKMGSYGQSKLANLLFTYELQRRLTKAQANVICTAAHPGWTATDLQRYSGLIHFFNPFFAQKPEMGCLPTLRAAIDENAKDGDYYGPSGFQEMRGYPQRVRSNGKSHDEAAAKRLWEVSEEMTAVKLRSI